MVAAVVIELARGQEKGRCSSQGDPLFARCAHYETDCPPLSLLPAQTPTR
jgi:hypothetical protein